MVKKQENIIVGISVGDLNGVGSEIILKTFEDSRMLEMCTPVIFANVKVLSYINKKLHLNLNFQGIENLTQLVPGKINVINIWKEHVDIQFGEFTEVAGKYALLSFEAATEALKDGLINTLITAPVNKYNIQTEGFKFPGHTDYLNQQLEGEALMLMVHDNLRVGLVTDHVPVSKVVDVLNEELIRKKIAILKQSLIQDFQIQKPKIAVLGVNPHCGDNGVIGDEDDVLLKPVLRKVFDEGTMVFGPYSADGFFGNRSYEKFDAVLAIYHDQGLIPFKTIAFGEGVNYTAGLNKIRTSPDHGTALDIAGKGIADFESFKRAVYLSIDIYNNREMYKKMTENPLKIKEKQLESKK